MAGAGLFAMFSFMVGRKFPNNHLHDDAIFLLNVLIILLLGPRSWPATYVWLILPMALFLCSLLAENVRVAYLVFVGLGVILLSSTLVQFFLIQAISQMNHMQLIELPLLIVGNLIMVASLTLLLVRIDAVKVCDARSKTIMTPK